MDSFLEIFRISGTIIFQNIFELLEGKIKVKMSSQNSPYWTFDL